MDQEVIRRFLNEGYWEKHIHKMRVVYRKKRDRLVFEIEYFSNRVEVIGEDSGLHILLKVHNGMREEELIQKLRNIVSKYILCLRTIKTILHLKM